MHGPSQGSRHPATGHGRDPRSAPPSQRYVKESEPVIKLRALSGFALTVAREIPVLLRTTAAAGFHRPRTNDTEFHERDCWQS